MKKILFVIGCGIIAFSSCNQPSTGIAQEKCCSPQKDSLEFVMNIPIKIKPEYVSAYKKAFEKCQAGTLKEVTCLDYYLYQSYTDSTEFNLLERWKNKPGHLAHMKTDHFKVYIAEVKGMNDKPRFKTITTYACSCAN